VLNDTTKQTVTLSKTLLHKLHNLALHFLNKSTTSGCNYALVMGQ